MEIGVPLVRRGATDEEIWQAWSDAHLTPDELSSGWRAAQEEWGARAAGASQIERAQSNAPMADNESDSEQEDVESEYVGSSRVGPEERRASEAEYEDPWPLLHFRPASEMFGAAAGSAQSSSGAAQSSGGVARPDVVRGGYRFHVVPGFGIDQEGRGPPETRAERNAAWEQAARIDDYTAQRREVRAHMRGRQHCQPALPKVPEPNEPPPADGDCRGEASWEKAAERYWLADRRDSLHEGYCRRTTCECCAQTKDEKAATGFWGRRWCSCKAVQDGLCRRCWLDEFRGYEGRQQYTGPKPPAGFPKDAKFRSKV